MLEASPQHHYDRDHARAPLLVAALCFSQSGRLVRVAGLSSGQQLVEQSFLQMLAPSGLHS